MAHEVVVTQLRPQLLGLVRVGAVAHQTVERRPLGLANLLLALQRVFQPALECPLGRGVQLSQQAGPPGIPQRRVGGVNVGHGVHVQIVQVRFIADRLGEVVDHLRVGEILALGGRRHHQVVLNQPDHQARIPGRQLVADAERLGVHGAELGVVAAAALRDVVIEAGDIDQFGLGQALHDLAGQRILLRDAGLAQLAQVLDDVEGVRIHGIDVEQVVLHLPDDMTELGKVAAEDSVAIHPTQVAMDTFLALEQLDEQAGVADVAAELVVDQMPMVAQQADGFGAHTLNPRVLRQQHEDLEDGEGRAFEYRVVGDLQIVVAHQETAVERHGGPAVAFPENHLGKVLAHQVAEFGNAHHHPVVLLHETLDRELGVVVFVAEQGGEAALVIEQQAILGTAGQHVQPVSDAPEKRLGRNQQRVFAFGEKALVDDGVQVQRAELAACDPEDGLDVAQPARGALDIGLQVVLGVVVLGMAGALLVALGEEELLARPHFVRAGDLQHVLPQVLGAGDGAAFHQVGDHRQVRARLFGAFGHRTHALADLQADVPEQCQKAFDGLAENFPVAVIEQDQQVDVGVGVQLAAAIASHRHQRDIGIFVPVEALPGGAQNLVDEPGAVLDQAPDIPPSQEARIENLARLADHLLEGGDGAGLERQLGLELTAIEQLGVNLRHALALLRGSWLGKGVRPMCARWCHPCAA